MEQEYSNDTTTTLDFMTLDTCVSMQKVVGFPTTHVPAFLRDVSSIEIRYQLQYTSVLGDMLFIRLVYNVYCKDPSKSAADAAVAPVDFFFLHRLRNFLCFLIFDWIFSSYFQVYHVLRCLPTVRIQAREIVSQRYSFGPHAHICHDGFAVLRVF